jgi:hypothetical protein
MRPRQTDLGNPARHRHPVIRDRCLFQFLVVVDAQRRKGSQVANCGNHQKPAVETAGQIPQPAYHVVADEARYVGYGIDIGHAGRRAAPLRNAVGIDRNTGSTANIPNEAKLSMNSRTYGFGVNAVSTRPAEAIRNVTAV